MLESSITKSIQRHAKSCGWWQMKIAGGPFQKAGVPDLLLIKGGKAVFLEVKQPGKKATLLQQQVMKEISETGGAVTAVVTSKAEADKVLREAHP
jgi:hypothetical protein